MEQHNEILQEIVTLVKDHFTKWPVATSQCTLMEFISKVSSHPTVKEWDCVRWQNETDTIIQLSQFNIELLKLIHRVEEHLPVSTLIPVNDECKRIGTTGITKPN